MLKTALPLCCLLMLACSSGLSVVSAQVRVMNDPTFSFNARSGKMHRVQFYWDVNEDCSVPRGFSISIERPPSNGRIELKKTDQVITLAMARWRELRGSDERRHYGMKCLGKPITVLSLYYASRPGFRGVDSFKVLATWPQWNRVRHQEFRVVVN